MQWTFGEFLWGTIVVFLWVAFIWMFVAVFTDVFRRDDLTGWAKVGWTLLILILPFIGILIYMAVRPRMTEQDRRMLEQQREIEHRVSGYSASDEIAKAARLQQEGAITPAEFEQLKREALAHEAAM